MKYRSPAEGEWFGRPGRRPESFDAKQPWSASLLRMGALRCYFNAGVRALPGVQLGLSENGGKAETRSLVLARGFILASLKGFARTCHPQAQGITFSPIPLIYWSFP